MVLSVAASMGMPLVKGAMMPPACGCDMPLGASASGGFPPALLTVNKWSSFSAPRLGGGASIGPGPPLPVVASMPLPPPEGGGGSGTCIGALLPPAGALGSWLRPVACAGPAPTRPKDALLTPACFETVAAEAPAGPPAPCAASGPGGGCLGGKRPGDGPPGPGNLQKLGSPAAPGYVGGGGLIIPAPSGGGPPAPRGAGPGKVPEAPKPATGMDCMPAVAIPIGGGPPIIMPGTPPGMAPGILAPWLLVAGLVCW
mmetsp:Transcript_83884/g.245963  ORF Transcript_83884/g.245963 Transcript_83884/m.245963 type:complete len:256 (-) Transcript_83884:1233-2000(-)